MPFNAMSRCVGISACPDFTLRNEVSREFNFFSYQISPNSLTEGGVEVTRVVQKEGQFVVVFPEVISLRTVVRTQF